MSLENDINGIIKELEKPAKQLESLNEVKSKKTMPLQEALEKCGREQKVVEPVKEK